uniref:Uncharacterized protein n=1 Tax=Molossus molossus TaxID=27622 RepID=A0A7J8JWD5_MOLMO|nr:hypothetical protein HJG59_008114 [Molossus molossus]
MACDMPSSQARSTFCFFLLPEMETMKAGVWSPASSDLQALVSSCRPLRSPGEGASKDRVSTAPEEGLFWEGPQPCLPQTQWLLHPAHTPAWHFLVSTCSVSGKRVPLYSQGCPFSSRRRSQTPWLPCPARPLKPCQQGPPRAHFRA